MRIIATGLFAGGVFALATTAGAAELPKSTQAILAKLKL